jgi:hypothetical protein
VVHLVFALLLASAQIFWAVADDLPHGKPAASDSFLVLDVNPANADWVWMPTKTLIKGMRTFDKIENRGYILVVPP